jgi:hypothetical protein
MATAKKTIDTDSITVRKIIALNENDSFISTGYVLASLGGGVTEWVFPSTVTAFPSYNRVIANGTQMPADQAFNTLTLSTLDGIGMNVNGPQKQIYFFNKAFTEIDVQGGNPIYGYSQGTVTPTIKFIGDGSVSISSDPLTNTIRFSGVPTAISTGIYAYNKINVISNAPQISTNQNSSILTATSPSSILTFLGLGDIILSTNITSSIITVGISTFTSREYQQISTLASSNVSTVSTLFYDNGKINIATSSLLNTISNVSVGIFNRINYDANYFTTFYTQLNTFATVSSSTSAKLNQKINFTSSLGYDERGISQLGSIDLDNTFVFSTATFNISTMSSLLNLNANLEIRESVGLIFPTNNSPNTIFTVSTFLLANDVFLPSTVYTIPWMATNGTGSNVLSESIFMTLDPITLQTKSYDGSYSIVHRITNYAFSGYEVVNSNSEKNSVSLHFYKS